MNIWRDIVLIISVLGMLAFGYFLAAGLDKFLIKNSDSIESGDEKEEPSGMMLTENLTDEEIVEEILKFREKHENDCIIIYACSPAGLSGEQKCRTGQKR